MSNERNTRNYFKINKLNLSKEYLVSMNYFEKCELLNSNPVLLVRLFQHSNETFFKEILLIPLRTIGKVTYLAIRMEHSVRGAQHVQSFISILNPPKLSEKALRTYIKFIDNTIHTNLLDDPILYQLVNQYQTHEHSKSCRKYKNKLCRYGFS